MRETKPINQNMIKFCIRIVDHDNMPIPGQLIHCVETTEASDAQSIKQETDEDGKAEFKFETSKKSIEIDLQAQGNTFNYEFRDGDFVTFKLLTDDNLNIFMELLLDHDAKTIEQ